MPRRRTSSAAESTGDSALRRRLTSSKGSSGITEPARVGEHTFDVLTRSRGSGAAGVELRELELGLSDGAEARVGNARHNAAVDLAGAFGNAEEGHRAAATAVARSDGASRT